MSFSSKLRRRIKWFLLAAVALGLFWCGSWLWGLRQVLAARNTVEQAGGLVKTRQGAIPGRLFETVTEVVVRYCNVAKLRALWPQLMRFEELEKLTFFTVDVTDQHLEALQALPKLRSLNLQGTGVRGPGLAYLRDFPSLRELRLDNITDDALQHLRGCPVRRLGLHRCGEVSDEGATRFKTLPNLKRLELVRTGVTKEGVQGLRAALPNVEIIHQNDRWASDGGGVY